MFCGGLLIAAGVNAFGYEPSYSDAPNFYKGVFALAVVLFVIPVMGIINSLLDAESLHNFSFGRAKLHSLLRFGETVRRKLLK
jgi:hypothetical protein